MISVIPRTSSLFIQVVKETVHTALRRPYSDLTQNEADWITRQWLLLFDEIKKDTIVMYRGLVLGNRERPIGKLALVFNAQLYQAGKTKNLGLLRRTLFEVPLPEVDRNAMLTEKEKMEVLKYLKNEMLILNHLIDTEALKSGPISKKIINSTFHGNSQKDVCLSPIGGITSSNEVELGIIPVERLQVPDRPEGRSATIVGCFNLLDLLYLIVSGDNNPYTGEPLSFATCEILSRRFAIQLKMFHQGNLCLNGKSS